MLRSAACATLLFSATAFAAIYESPISADDEDDLRAAAERGEISDATLETLVELMQDGVDLNNAGREELYELPGLTYADVDAIVTYRKNEGHIDDPSVLVGAGAITAEQLLQIAPFIVLSAEQVKVPIGGRYRLLGNYTVGDNLAPPFIADVRLKGPFGFTGEVNIAGTRQHTGAPFYDPLRDALQVTPAQYRVEIPKFYLQWKGSKINVVAGTFRIGFGQRLTLDNTTRYTPNGERPEANWYVNPEWALTTSCRYSAGELAAAPCPPGPDYVTADFKWRDVFRGVAVSGNNLELGDTAKVSFFAFGSYQTFSIYQYELYDRRYCLDPRDDATSACASPPVYLRTGDGTDPEARVSFTTLQNVYDEIAFGGHVSISPVPMLDIGLTGYGAIPRFHVPEMQLDFQEWSKRPFGGAFGAVGVDARVTIAVWNLYLEVARSFDHLPGGGGGWGVVQRSVWGKKSNELEILARFYDIRFVNPYARPVASPDELDGQRARNEAGLRVKYTDRHLGDFTLTGNIDFWLLPWDEKNLEGQITGNNRGFTAGTMNLRAEARVDYKGWTFFEPGVFVRYGNYDLAHTGYGACYGTSEGRAVPLFSGEPVLCTGERYLAGVRTRFRFLPRQRLELDLVYNHAFISDAAYDDKLSQDLRFKAEIRSKPVEWLLLRAGARYLKYDIFSTNRLEESLWTNLSVKYLGLKWFHVEARYDTYIWLDKRASTTVRTPNPEHRLRLEFEGRF